MNPVKKGVSKLILETNPIVLPLYHEGMEKGEEKNFLIFLVLPKGKLFKSKVVKVLLFQE
jgi:hypothetical protein